MKSIAGVCDRLSGNPAMAVGDRRLHWPKRLTPFRLVTLLSCLLGLYLRSQFHFDSRYTPSGLADDEIDAFNDRAINNTIVIVPVNSGMLHWADNLLCSLRQTSFNTSKVVFWALDAEVQATLRLRGHAAYRDASLFATRSNENFRGNTKAYTRMMRERPKFYINILSAGFDILMLDADTIWWQSPELLIPQPEDRTIDAVFSTDAREFYQTHNAFKDIFRRGSLMPPICNGIFWMRSNAHTISLWSEMLAVFETPAPMGWLRRWNSQDDQRAMDVLLNDGRAAVTPPLPDGISVDIVPKPRRKPRLAVSLLDQTLVVNGNLLMNRRETYEANRVRLRERGDERIAAHFNWSTGLITKEEGSRKLDMYFLDENGKCRF